MTNRWQLVTLGSCAALSCAHPRDRDPERGSSESASRASPAREWPEAAWSAGGVRVRGAPLDDRTTLRTKHGALVTLPTRADDVLRVEAGEHRWIEQRAVDLGSALGTRETDRMRFAAADVDVVRFTTDEGAEEVRVLAQAGGVRRASYRVGLGGGLTQLRLRDGLVEALDAEGRAWLRSPRPIAVDAVGIKRDADVTLARDGAGWTVVVTLATDGLRAPIALDPGWFLTTTMSTNRANFATAKLAGGKVLVTGGDQDGYYPSALSTAEIFDPGTKTFTTTGSMGVRRNRHAAATLADGTVLVAGGGDCVICSGAPMSPTLLSSAEIWNGATWAPAAAMAKARVSPALIMVSAKAVLAAGGAVPPNLTDKSGEVYDPTTNKWSAPTNAMTDFRVAAGVAKLGSGRILVFGGANYTAGAASADTYDPITNSFATAGKMSVARVLASSGVLDDGSVIVAGGSKDLNSCCFTSAPSPTADVYTPSTGVWKSIPGPKVAHSGAATLVIPDAAGAPTGKLLVAGGFGGGSAKTSPLFDVDIYDRATGTWNRYGYLSIGRTFAQAAAIGTSDVVVFGGATGDYDWSKSYVSTGAAETTGTALPSSSKCTEGGNCTSGFCVDGRCCNAACTGTCEACDVPGSEGNCVPVNGRAHGGRAPCVGTPECAKTCDGVSSTCAQGKATTKCGGATCTGHMIALGGTCSGDSVNACNLAAATACPGDFLCDTPAACKTTCTSDLECVAGKVCNTSAGTCTAPVPDAGPDTFVPDTFVPDTTEPDTLVPDTSVADSRATYDDAPVSIPAKPTVGDFQRCIHDTDCPSKHCVDGVCCNTACTDRCHSCALLAAPGICTLEPAGVDLRNDCGAAESCTGTCGPSGECIGAGAGSMCARNQCVGASSGVGPAYCVAPGALCSNAMVVPFDCAPYACAPAFGACLTVCVSSEDCANGFVCDVGSKSCVSPAPPPDKSGCAISTEIGNSPGGAAPVSVLFLAAAVGLVARLRRRLR